MLTKEDLQAIKELIYGSEERMTGKIAESEERTRNEMRVLFEAQDRKISLLAENQQTMMEMLAPKTRLEELEDEINFLKNVVKMLSKEVNELKAG